MTQNMNGWSGRVWSQTKEAPSRMQHSSSVLLHRFIVEEMHYIPLLFKSIATGLMIGLVSLGFNYCSDLLRNSRSIALQGDLLPGLPPWIPGIVMPALLVAIALTLINTYAPEAGGSGIQEIEGALEGVRPMRWKRLLPIKFIGGMCALGSNLIIGREGPTVQMGGNLGKMVSDVTHTDSERGDVLVAAGAGAGLAAAFNAPLSGMIFVMEEMHAQFKYKFLYIMSVCAACISAVTVMRLFLGQNPLLTMPQSVSPNLLALVLFAFLGWLFGVLGYVFNHMILGSLALFDSLRRVPVWITGAVVGALIGAISMNNPLLGGGGMDDIITLVKGHLPITALLIIFTMRLVLTTFCYGSGVPGGIFAPMLALGTLFGVAFGHSVHVLFPGLDTTPAMYAVASMAALFAATVRAPLTGIILTLEMTMDFNLILPMMVTCLVASVTAYGLDAHPIYALLLKRTLEKSRHAGISPADPESAPPPPVEKG